MPLQHRKYEDEEDDLDYDTTTPLQRIRPPGSGLYKQPPIAFVRASSDAPSIQPTKPKPDPAAVADLYLSLVLPKEGQKPKEEESKAKERALSAPPTSQPKAPQSPTPGTSRTDSPVLDCQSPEPQTNYASDEKEEQELCPTCRLPLSTNSTTPHHLTLAHQLSLPHSHPPSHLDRTRMGLNYLASYGWDPDSRKGLGVEGQGIVAPIKVKERGREGLGMEVSKHKDGTVKREKPKLLDAKKVRRMYREEREKGEKIRRELFGDGKIEKYLGKGAL